MRKPRSGIIMVVTVAVVSVLAGAVPAAADAGGALAATGLAPETFLWAGLGAGVLILGAVLLIASRRRARRDAQSAEGEAEAGPVDPTT